MAFSKAIFISGGDEEFLCFRPLQTAKGSGKCFD
jgi:hypothetical protein